MPSAAQRNRMQILLFCEHALSRTDRVAAEHIGGSARGYQESFASFGMAVLVTARRSGGQAVYLSTAKLQSPLVAS